MKKASKPTISIITACYNALPALKHTINNVQEQSYTHKEHIIIDGHSTDGTQNYLKKLSSKLHASQSTNNSGGFKWLSEPDKGISDAFNKGVAMAQGDYLFFLGAGDTFVHSKVLETVFNRLISRPQLICGKVLRVSEDNKPLWQAPKRWPKVFDKTSLLKKLTLPHQGLFMHRSYFNRYGLFDLNCHFAMDYELLLRAFHQFPSVLLVDEVIAHWQAGGIGQGRLHEIYDEYHRIKMKHQVASAWKLKSIDYWNRVKLTLKSKGTA